MSFQPIKNYIALLQMYYVMLRVTHLQNTILKYP